MKRLALTLALSLLTLPALAQTVVFRDDFDGTALDKTKWSVGTWKLGRTQLGNTPIVGRGIARLPFDTYELKGTEIATQAEFARGKGVEFAARLRLNNLPSGLVAALFTYITHNQTSDELDIEILTKQINAAKDGAPLLLSTWNDWNERTPTYQDGIHHASIPTVVAGLKVNTWHTYVIRWLPDHTEWLIDGKLVASSTKAQPDQTTNLRLNFWAAAPSWVEAHDADLKSPAKAKESQRYFYDVDWVEVRQL